LRKENPKQEFPPSPPYSNKNVVDFRLNELGYPLINCDLWTITCTLGLPT
jgi:hypothetical protein